MNDSKNILLKKITTALFKGTFGIVFPRGKTRIKMLEIGDWSIAFREGKEGILMLYEFSKDTLELQYKGKKFKDISQKIKNLIINDVKNIIISKIN
ncbi:MAG: hypothetical protein ACTSVY_05780 [Candidatus Helarchaeota archaeon]